MYNTTLYKVHTIQTHNNNTTERQYNNIKL